MGEAIINYYALTVIFSLFVAVFAITFTAFIFLSWKGIQPVRARARGLSIIFSIGCFIVIVNNHMDGIGESDCIREMLITSIGANMVIYSCVVQAIRLLIIFNITEEKIDYRIEENDKDDPNNPDEQESISTRRSLLSHKPRYLNETFLSLLVLGISAFFCLFSVASFLANMNNIDKACTSIIYSIGWGISLLVVAALFITVLVKLKKVHDAYWIKYEFIALTILIVFIAFPGFTLKFFNLRPVGQLVFELALMVAYCISVAIPTCIGLKTHYFASFHETSSTEGKSSFGRTGSAAELELKQTDELYEQSRSAFVEFPRVAKFLGDPLAHKYLRDYLLDYQDMRMSDYLNFWEQVQEFRKLPKDFLGGKGYLLYQKFLSKNAYRKIDCVTDPLREPLEATLTRVIDGQDHIESSFFDPILDIAEGVMNAELFKPFFHSKFYDQYKEAVKLRTQMEKLQQQV